ncbi:MAG: aspartyl protease family protein [Rhodospirillaceae bacterium]|nr:aspartyl protease family protein [Rhodospirillaceae bacterium]
MQKIECGFPNEPDFLVVYGPTLKVRIGFDTEFRDGVRPDLPATEHAALVDTGAFSSCIDSTLAATLRLPVIDRRLVSGVHGEAEVNVHLAQIYIPSLKLTTKGPFAAVHLHAGGQPYGALFGRSFLRFFTMTYDGKNGTVELIRDN